MEKKPYYKKNWNGKGKTNCEQWTVNISLWGISEGQKVPAPIRRKKENVELTGITDLNPWTLTFELWTLNPNGYR